MTDKSEILNDVYGDIKKKLPEVFVHLGGVSTPKKPLSAKWTLEAAQDAFAATGINFEKEIKDALAQEVSAELMLRLYNKARELPVLETLSAKGQADMQKATIRLHEIANSLDPRCSIVVSPTFLTILQSGGEGIFVRSEDREAGDSYVGEFGGHKLFVDPYATDKIPALIAAPGWFEFEAGTFIYDGGVIMDPTTFEPTIQFYDDVKYTITVAKTITVGLDVATMSFI